MPSRRKSKKRWDTPLLTVVVRGNPEERMLLVCKNVSTPEAGANWTPYWGRIGDEAHCRLLMNS